ncbi:MAG: Xaa-Pro peptidase family protein [Chloroflexota bacterium]
MNDVIGAKALQATALLKEFGLPVWIVQFARETYDHPQPVQDLLVGATVTWPAAFILSDKGDSIAIVGSGDATNIQEVGAYSEVIPYVRDVGPPLRDVLSRLDPSSIGVSYSTDDDSADNITHGMYLILEDVLRDTPYCDRLVSAAEVLGALRARKLPIEVQRIEASVADTVELFSFIEGILLPGTTERRVASGVHEEILRTGYSTAWDRRYDPIVNFGPESAFGHSQPSDTVLECGMLVHVDLGIKRQGYCSDLQRMWYLLEDDEDGAPPDVEAAFRAVVDAIRAGFETLRPGISGWEVDDAARKVLTGAGYAEPEFALGHQLGQSTHDGGSLLGPRWPRYLDRPMRRVEEGNVFTLEYAIRTSAGTLGVEEDVVVTSSGARYLTDPQTALVCLRR